MKIAWHMPRLRRSCCGLSIRALCLADGLRHYGHEITFIVADGKTDVRHNSIGGHSLRRLTAPCFKPMHWSLQALARRRSAVALAARIEDDHDLMISCQPEFIDAYRKKNRNRPLIFVCGGTTLLHDEADRRQAQIHRFPSRPLMALDRFLKHRHEKAAFRSADAIVFDSDATRKLVIQEYAMDADRCHTIHGGVDLDRFLPPSTEDRSEARRRLGIANTSRVLVWTGRLSPEKNLGLLFQAISLCRPRLDRMLIVGDGPAREELSAYCDHLGLTEIVTFSGEQADVRPFLHAADLFVFPSRGESFGGSLVEAMACGLPCIALKPNGAAIRNASLEIIEHDKSGQLVDRPEPGALAAAIDRLMTNVEKRIELGQAARRRVEARFTWNRAAERLNELVHCVASSKTPDRLLLDFRAAEAALSH